MKFYIILIIVLLFSFIFINKYFLKKKSIEYKYFLKDNCIYKTDGKNKILVLSLNPHKYKFANKRSGKMDMYFKQIVIQDTIILDNTVMTLEDEEIMIEDLIKKLLSNLTKLPTKMFSNVSFREDKIDSVVLKAKVCGLNSELVNETCVCLNNYFYGYDNETSEGLCVVDGNVFTNYYAKGLTLVPYNSQNIPNQTIINPLDSIPTQNLMLCLDASVEKSYPGYGDKWYDISGREKNFTFNQEPTFNQVEKCFTFSKPTDFSYITNLDMTITNGNATFIFIVKPNILFNLFNTLLSSRNSSSFYQIGTRRFDDSNNLNVTWESSTNTTNYNTYQPLINNEWVFVALSNSRFYYRTYINTEYIETPRSVLNLNIDLNNVLIGNDISNLTRNFTGDIAACLIYNINLDDNQINIIYNYYKNIYNLPSQIRQSVSNSALCLWLDANNYSGSGDNWNDMSGRNKNATLIENPTFNNLGYFNFNGTSQYAQVSNLDFKSNWGHGTIISIVRLNNLSQMDLAGIVCSRDTRGYGLIIPYKNSVPYFGSMWDSKAFNLPSTYNSTNYFTFSENTWSFIAHVQTNSYFRRYFNSDYKQTNLTSISNIDPLNNFSIGRDPGTSTIPIIYFQGDIGVVLIYNRALGDNEIKNIYNYYCTKYDLPVCPSSLTAFSNIPTKYYQRYVPRLISNDNIVICSLDKVSKYIIDKTTNLRKVIIDTNYLDKFYINKIQNDKDKVTDIIKYLSNFDKSILDLNYELSFVNRKFLISFSNTSINSTKNLCTLTKPLVPNIANVQFYFDIDYPGCYSKNEPTRFYSKYNTLGDNKIYFFEFDSAPELLQDGFLRITNQSAILKVQDPVTGLISNATFTYNNKNMSSVIYARIFDNAWHRFLEFNNDNTRNNNVPDFFGTTYRQSSVSPFPDVLYNYIYWHLQERQLFNRTNTTIPLNIPNLYYFQLSSSGIYSLLNGTAQTNFSSTTLLPLSSLYNLSSYSYDEIKIPKPNIGSIIDLNTIIIMANVNLVAGSVNSSSALTLFLRNKFLEPERPLECPFDLVIGNRVQIDCKYPNITSNIISISELAIYNDTYNIYSLMTSSPSSSSPRTNGTLSSCLDNDMNSYIETVSSPSAFIRIGINSTTNNIISTIVILNRYDSNQYNLVGNTVSILDTNNNIIFKHLILSEQFKYTIQVKRNQYPLLSVVTRYLRIVRTDNQPISINLTEFRAINDYDEYIVPSSILASSPIITTNLIDHNFDTFVETNADVNAFVELDLGTNMNISKISVINRIGTNQNNIIGCSLILLDENKMETYIYNFTEIKNCYEIIVS
jgi:hypothetical protein